MRQIFRDSVIDILLNILVIFLFFGIECYELIITACVGFHQRVRLLADGFLFVLSSRIRFERVFHFVHIRSVSAYPLAARFYQIKALLTVNGNFYLIRKHFVADFYRTGDSHASFRQAISLYIVNRIVGEQFFNRLSAFRVADAGKPLLIERQNLSVTADPLHGFHAAFRKRGIIESKPGGEFVFLIDGKIAGSAANIKTIGFIL